MLFYEPLFLVLFPLLYVVYFAVAGDRAKRWVLLVASALFYLWGEPIFVPIVIASSLLDYLLTNRLVASRHAATRHLLLGLGVVGNIAILLVYKYSDFAIENLNAVSTAFGGPNWSLLHIALPIGVSFVVFEKITYLVDTYRGVSKPAPRFSDYCLFVLFFPKLLAGPILKYHEMERQIAKPAGFSWHDFWQGFLRFARGIFKKLLIADPLLAAAPTRSSARILGGSARAMHGSASFASRCRSISISPAIPIWRSAPRGCWDSACAKTSTCPILPAR